MGAVVGLGPAQAVQPFRNSLGFTGRALSLAMQPTSHTTASGALICILLPWETDSGWVVKFEINEVESLSRSYISEFMSEVANFVQRNMCRSRAIIRAANIDTAVHLGTTRGWFDPSPCSSPTPRLRF
jgi:hypothetical protein